MRISFVEVANFRKLKSVRIDLSEETTLLVGANNSGKTSAMDALRQFLMHGHRFQLTDFTLSDLPSLKSIGVAWERAANLWGEADAEPVDDVDSAEELRASLDALLPTLDIWIQAEESELHRVRQLLPVIGEYPGIVGVRLRWEPRDFGLLQNAYLARRRAVVETLVGADATSDGLNLWPADLVDYLGRQLAESFHLAAYKLNPSAIQPAARVAGAEVGIAGADLEVKLQEVSGGDEALDVNLLTKLIRVDIVNAQRGLGNQDGAGRLSKQISTYYSKHLDFDQKPERGDLAAIKATQEASKQFDSRLKDAFKIPLAEVARMGYPGGSNPRVVIRTSLRLTDGLKHDSVLKYQIGPQSADGDDEQLELPEGMNGLGYQNLVLMIFNLMMFRDARLRRGKAKISLGAGDEYGEIAPIHLVLVEEPEAHLHAQVQQVFINRAYKTLTETQQEASDDSEMQLSTQLVISTHSSHIAHEIAFSSIRYFRRAGLGGADEVPTTLVKNLASVFGQGTKTAKFVQRYLKVQHCNIFFADALVLMEGAAERILIPHFVEEGYPELHQSYVEYLDIGGAHSHRLRGLVDAIGIPTLVLTDLDAAEGASSSRVRPGIGASQVTSNAALTKWLCQGEDLDTLLGLEASQKIVTSAAGGLVKFSYQTQTEVSFAGRPQGTVIASTFEDALVFVNTDLMARIKGAGLANKVSSALSELANGSELSGVADTIYEALRKEDKAKFALDVLWSIPKLGKMTAPEYIAEGLEWLQTSVAALPLVEGAPRVTVAPGSSARPEGANS